MFQDSEELFNFVPINQPVQQTTVQKTLNLARKRSKTDQTFYQFIKKPVSRGTKIIKIEIYDTDSFQKSEQPMCNCEADVCVQHVVKTILYDDIYTSTRELIAKIQDDIEPRV